MLKIIFLFVIFALVFILIYKLVKNYEDFIILITLYPNNELTDYFVSFIIPVLQLRYEDNIVLNFIDENNTSLPKINYLDNKKTIYFEGNIFDLSELFLFIEFLRNGRILK